MLLNIYLNLTNNKMDLEQIKYKIMKILNGGD